MPTKTPTKKSTETSTPMDHGLASFNPMKKTSTPSKSDASLPPPTTPPKSIGEKLRRDFGIMTPAELAAMLEVSEHTLHSWRQRNQGPVFTYLGRRTYYRKADIHSWIDDGLVRADFVDRVPQPAEPLELNREAFLRG
jgi:DNA-binding transcriptional regulator YiaG